VVNVQIKVVTTTMGRKDKKPSDFGRLAKIMRDAHYRGYIVLEYEEELDPRKECPRFLDEIRKAFT
jgi:hypothetical protein